MIRGRKIDVPIVQGGMGVGISLSPLAAAVAREGGMGIISSACLDRIVSKRNGKRVNSYEAAYEEVCLAKEAGGRHVGMNVMVALARDYEESVKGAIDAGAAAIISGAGLPLSLPLIRPSGDTALVPIVSSARALEIVCRKWERAGRRPDAVVLEGPLAGGHLGFKIDELDMESNRLENLLPQVKDVALKHGDFPVIVAGGIYSHDDITRFLRMGASGVQMGTRFLATEESSAPLEYKQAVISARKEDIVVAQTPGSPCGLPFRVIRQSAMFDSAQKRLRTPRCDKGYVLQKDIEGKFTRCPAKDNKDYFCICNGLLSSSGHNPEEEPLFTCGTNACRVDRILSVHDLMEELKDAAAGGIEAAGEGYCR
ncbi:MAG: nitronate monooxygenase [Nitrospiraceae bacterium]|nr:nitronate monooxygenase [Nitrospiraceae bacterium]